MRKQKRLSITRGHKEQVGICTKLNIFNISHAKGTTFFDIINIIIIFLKRCIMNSNNTNLDFLFTEIKSLTENQRKLESRIQELERRISSEGLKFKLSLNHKKSIHLYIDMDEVIFEDIENHDEQNILHKFRDGTIEFLYWCMENFNCYWLTKLKKSYLEQLIYLENAEPLLQIEYIDLSGKKSKPAAIDIYKDFYWLTAHKGNSAINEMRDDFYGYRKLSIKQQPINDIKKILFEKLYRRASSKLGGIGQSRPKGLGWGDGSYSNGGSIYFRFELEEYFELVLETREIFLFKIYWRLHISSKEETMDLLVSEGLEEFIFHLENELLSILKNCKEEKFNEIITTYLS